MAFAVLVACGKDAAPPAPANVAQPIDAAASRELPPPRQDPTLRFVKPEWTADRAGDLVRPVPWIPDAPELEELIPRGAISMLEEAWSLTRTGLVHRVQMVVVPEDNTAVTTLRRAIIALGTRLTARTDVPVMTYLDRGTDTVAFGDLGDRSILASVDEKRDGRTIELVLAVTVPPAGGDAIIAQLLAGSQARSLAPLGETTRVTAVVYRRVVDRVPRFDVKGERVVGAAEAAAHEAVLAKSTVDTMDADTTKLGRASAPYHDAWKAAATRAITRAGFRFARKSEYGIAEYERAPNGSFFFLDDSWTLSVGERDAP